MVFLRREEGMDVGVVADLFDWLCIAFESVRVI